MLDFWGNGIVSGGQSTMVLYIRLEGERGSSWLNAMHAFSVSLSTGCVFGEQNDGIFGNIMSF